MKFNSLFEILFIYTMKSERLLEIIHAIVLFAWFLVNLLFLWFYLFFGNDFLEIINYHNVYYFCLNFLFFIFFYFFSVITCFLTFTQNIHRFSFIITGIFILIIFFATNTHIDLFYKIIIPASIITSSLWVGEELAEYPRFLDYLKILGKTILFFIFFIFLYFLYFFIFLFEII